MFLTADILVKVVMVGLAFASQVTWTIFLAKSVHLAFVRRRLHRALRRIAEAKSVAEAKMLLGAKGNGGT